jgi:hypothetical protein
MRLRSYPRRTLHVLCVLAAIEGVASAQTASPTSRDAAEQAGVLFQKARDFHQYAKWAEAEAAYQASWDIWKSFDTAGNLGECELEVGQPREAAEHLRYAFDHVPAGATPAQRRQLEATLQKAREQVGALRIQLSASGAAVFVDGRAVGTSPLPEEVFVEPGTRRIEAKLAGYRDATATVTISKGGAQAVTLTLTPIEASSGRSMVPAMVIGGIGVLGLAGGIGFLAVAGGKSSDADALSGEIRGGGGNCQNPGALFVMKCEELGETAADLDTMQKLGVGGFVLAGVALAGVATYLLWPASKTAPAQTTAVGVTPLDAGGAVLVFRGTF